MVKKKMQHESKLRFGKGEDMISQIKCAFLLFKFICRIHKLYYPPYR